MKELIEKILALPDNDIVEKNPGREFGVLIPDHTIADLKALADAVPRWIPCEERLPDEVGEDYLVTWEEITQVLFFDGDDWIFDNEPVEDVIAWMPLPAAYEGKQ